jgi:hypothetical protein
MTPVPMTARQFRRLTKNIVPRMAGRSELMTLHLLIVEAVHGRLTPEELRSARFTESRTDFVNLLLKWQEKPSQERKTK